MKEVAKININSLFKYFVFVSNFLQINIHDYDFNQPFTEDKFDVRIMQRKINYENGIKIIQMIEKKNDS